MSFGTIGSQTPSTQFFSYQNEIELSDGSKYDGPLKNGKPHGKGILRYLKGNECTRYDGEFSNGLPDGEGKMTYKDGSIYVGNMENGKREGRGLCSYPDGKTYNGMWANDTFNGQGTYTYDGKVYNGNFKNGAFDGHGKLTWPNGKTYEGNFENDILTGQGKLVEPSVGGGSVGYEGDFKDGSLWNGTYFVETNGYITHRSAYKNGKWEGIGNQCCVII